MALNPYFKYNTVSTEQDMIKDWVQEAIQINGIECTYLPREYQKEDKLYGEDVLSQFSASYVIEMYLENAEGFEGDQDILGKFGIEVRDECTLHCSTKTWSEIIGTKRPMEGDLIYFPLSNAMFEIRFVEDESQFYPAGTLPSFKLECQMFDYSMERFNTGLADIDAIDIHEVSDTISEDPENSDNEVIETESDELIDFTETNPWGNF